MDVCAVEEGLDHSVLDVLLGFKIDHSLGTVEKGGFGDRLHVFLGREVNSFGVG